MFGHRSFLRIGSLDDASIKGLLASGMELNPDYAIGIFWFRFMG